MSPTVVLLNISPWGDGGLLPGIGRDVNCLGYRWQRFNCPARSYAVTALQATDQMPSDEVVGLPGIRWFPDKKRWNRSKYGHSMACDGPHAVCSGHTARAGDRLRDRCRRRPARAPARGGGPAAPDIPKHLHLQFGQPTGNDSSPALARDRWASASGRRDFSSL